MDKYSQQAHLLKVLAHPVRLRILDLLRYSDECVCHLSVALGKSQPYVSQQLAVLRHAGIIVDRKEGTNVFYSLADERVARYLDAFLGPANQYASRQAMANCWCPKCLSGSLAHSMASTGIGASVIGV